MSAVEWSSSSWSTEPYEHSGPYRAVHEAPRTTIVLVGELQIRAATELAEHCADLRRQADVTITLDMSAVRSCDAAGLDVLETLHAGAAGPELVILGVRWSQFFGVLAEAPLEDLGAVCHRIRQLVWNARRVRHLAVPES